jgi:uncharacterized protein (TIGR03000 family)
MGTGTLVAITKSAALERSESFIVAPAKGWLTMFKHRLFLAAACSLGVLAMNPLLTEAGGGSGHGGGGHGGGGHSGGHSGGGSVHVAHAGVAHVSGAHVSAIHIAHVGGTHFANGTGGFNHGGRDFDRFGRDFNRRGFFNGGFYFPFGYGYGYGGYPYYDNYYNSYYNSPTYVAPAYDYIDPGYTPFVSPAYDYAPAANSYAPPAFDYAGPVQAPAASAPLKNTGEVIVYLPQPDAQVWVNGKSMPSNSSTRRSFVSPPLQTGRPYSYRISAAWVENGRQVRGDRTVSLAAGRAATVDFTSTPTLPQADD